MNYQRVAPFSELNLGQVPAYKNLDSEQNF